MPRATLWAPLYLELDSAQRGASVSGLCTQLRPAYQSHPALCTERGIAYRALVCDLILVSYHM